MRQAAERGRQLRRLAGRATELTDSGRNHTPGDFRRSSRCKSLPPGNGAAKLSPVRCTARSAGSVSLLVRRSRDHSHCSLLLHHGKLHSAAGWIEAPAGRATISQIVRQRVRHHPTGYHRPSAGTERVDTRPARLRFFQKEKRRAVHQNASPSRLDYLLAAQFHPTARRTFVVSPFGR